MYTDKRARSEMVVPPSFERDTPRPDAFFKREAQSNTPVMAPPELGQIAVIAAPEVITRNTTNNTAGLGGGKIAL